TDMGRYANIGITGTNGTVGRVLMTGLQHNYTLRAITRWETDIPSTIASFDSVEGLTEAFDGLEAIIHLAANPSPAAPVGQHPGQQHQRDTQETVD
ncbi:MAG: hypothetical protein VYD18_13585, partial [Candidatus Latescibacterota bacterium]|nr:hypothetical protein [Candidatus Latescibacterota bacterium]